MSDMEPVKRGRGRPVGSKDLVPRKRREDMANFGQEYVEQGDNAKYLRHALVIMGMPPIDISDAAQVEERVYWYFEHCVSNDMKPTVNGLCNALGIHRDTLHSWSRGDRRPGSAHQEIAQKAYRVLEGLWEDYMANGKINPVSGIFLGKNYFGYSDKQEYVLTPNQSGVQEMDVKTIEQKYAELPEE